MRHTLFIALAMLTMLSTGQNAMAQQQKKQQQQQQQTGMKHETTTQKQQAQPQQKAQPQQQKAKAKTVQQKPYYTKESNDKKLKQTAHSWVEKGEWRNGFTKASPASMVNETEFYEQYRKSPKVWQALFRWLEQTDLLAIPAGKVTIPGTSLVASIEDSKNEPLAKRKTESHYKNIDFMYVVKGKEGFRRLDHTTSTPSTQYKTDVIRYNYDANRAQKIVSQPGEFCIFFPSDWHIAKVETTDKKGRPDADQVLRVIVIKVPYIE